jgi:hypothetical protein
MEQQGGISLSDIRKITVCSSINQMRTKNRGARHVHVVLVTGVAGNQHASSELWLAVKLIKR